MIQTFFNKVYWLLAFGVTVAIAALGVGGKASSSAWEKTKEIQLSGSIYSIAWHPDGRHIAVTLDKNRAQVWDVEKNTGSEFIVSTRWLTNQSGREIGFSPNGKFLVIQDVKRNKSERSPFPTSIDHPLEMESRANISAYQLGRVLMWPSLAEYSKIMGPGSAMHGSEMTGFCWVGESRSIFAVHRNAAVAIYSFPEGKLLNEIPLVYPHASHPSIAHRLWWRMACHPKNSLIAVQGALANDQDLEKMGLPAKSGPTPIAIVNAEEVSLKRVIMSNDGLNGVLFTADGRYLTAFGFPPMQVWDVDKGFVELPPVKVPNDKTGTMVALEDDWIAGMANSMHIWRIGQQQKAHQDQPVARYSWRTAYHAPSRTIAIAHSNTLTLYRLNKDAVSFDSGR